MGKPVGVSELSRRCVLTSCFAPRPHPKPRERGYLVSAAVFGNAPTRILPQRGSAAIAYTSTKAPCRHAKSPLAIVRACLLARFCFAGALSGQLFETVIRTLTRADPPPDGPKLSRGTRRLLEVARGDAVTHRRDTGTGGRMRVPRRMRSRPWASARVLAGAGVRDCRASARCTSQCRLRVEGEVRDVGSLVVRPHLERRVVQARVPDLRRRRRPGQARRLALLSSRIRCPAIRAGAWHPAL